MAGPMVARSDGLVNDGTSAYEADLGLDVVVFFGGRGGRFRNRWNSSSAQLGFWRDVGRLGQDSGRCLTMSASPSSSS